MKKLFKFLRWIEQERIKAMVDTKTPLL